MADLTQELNLSVEARAALLRQESPLLPIVELVLAMENGDWSMISILALRLGIEETDAFLLYSQSIEWAVSVGRATTESE